MTHKPLLASLLLLAPVFTGCVASYGPGGTLPAIITESQVYPALNASTTVYNLDTDDFEIRETVRARGHATNILGIYSSGNNGYDQLYKNARDLGCDDVINVRVDVTASNYLFLMSKVETSLTGTGIKWK